jgi:hypothetical protein
MIGGESVLERVGFYIGRDDVLVSFSSEDTLVGTFSFVIGGERLLIPVKFYFESCYGDCFGSYLGDSFGISFGDSLGSSFGGSFDDSFGNS